MGNNLSARCACGAAYAALWDVVPDRCGAVMVYEGCAESNLADGIKSHNIGDGGFLSGGRQPGYCGDREIRFNRPTRQHKSLMSSTEIGCVLEIQKFTRSILERIYCRVDSRKTIFGIRQAVKVREQEPVEIIRMNVALKEVEE